MTLDDKPRFFSAMTMLAETWREPMSELRLEGYWIALEDIAIEPIEQAVAKCMRGAKYFPRPVEVREAVFGSEQDNTESAWLVWRQAAKRFGGAASVAITDAALADAIIAVFGSWPAACAKELSPEMWASTRKEFERTYRVMRQRGMTGVRYLPGSHEQNNSSRDDWQRFTPVGLIDGAEVKQLSGEQAARFRLTSPERKELL